MANAVDYLAQNTDPQHNIHPSNSDWDFEKMLTELTNEGSTIGGGIVALFGLVMVVVGCVKVAQKLFSDRSQGSWVSAIALLLIGGVFLFGGLTFVLNVANSANTTIDDLGSTALPLTLSWFH